MSVIFDCLLFGQTTKSVDLFTTPSNFNSSITYDPITNTYIKQDRYGDLNFGPPQILSFTEYQDYSNKNLISDYWKMRSSQRNGSNSSALGLPKLYIPGKSFDRVFGGNSVDIRPQGSSELIFGLKVEHVIKKRVLQNVKEKNDGYTLKLFQMVQTLV